MGTPRAWVSACLVVGLLVSTAGSVNIEAVPVGDPGNAGELSGAGAGIYGSDRICGSVDYRYDIGKYEVTAGQYTEFLNAVARTDTYGLYNTHMDTAVDSFGCNIKRTGSSGEYKYIVTLDWADRPVNFVSWGDAARFANWLANGQPTGAQITSTTEDGSYCLNGAMSRASLLAVTRKTTAAWVIPSEDEWYKAAYYKGGSTNAGYWDYATRSNTAPGQDMADASGNNANYYTAPYACPIDLGKYTTVVGEFQDSASPYGTFDQGGNVWEWNEAVLYGSHRGLRGGSFSNTLNDLHASARSNYNPASEYYTVGFRVVKLPEPGDFDSDGDVDSADFDLFKACVSGPAIPYPPGCSSKDLDADGDADQSDFGIFQQRYQPSVVLWVAESDGFASAGHEGGPFAPPSKIYTLTNTGGHPITWTAVNTQTWATLSKNGGMLAAGASDTVGISINAEANVLTVGSYSDTLAFTDTTNHTGGATRAVNLTVRSPLLPVHMVLVPAGEFNYQNGSPIYLAAFLIGKYEVTNASYCEFLNNDDKEGFHYYSEMEIDRSGAPGNYTYTVKIGKDNYPIQFVSWYDAAAFAEWRSQAEGRAFRLPTEQEWEKAAGWDPGEQKLYTYGYHSDSIDCSWLNFNRCIGNTTPVGYYSGTSDRKDAKSYYGCYDMSGNVWEWTDSWHTIDQSRVRRGGSWDFNEWPCSCTYRNPSKPSGRNGVGFRLALDGE